MDGWMDGWMDVEAAVGVDANRVSHGDSHKSNDCGIDAMAGGCKLQSRRDLSKLDGPSGWIAETQRMR